MALRVWLPLNGTLENKGISDITVTNHGATVDNNGKIGKCYAFNSNYIAVTNLPLSSFSNEASLSCWVKLPTTHSAYAQIMTIGTQGTSWNNIIFGIDINSSGIPIAAISTGSASTQCNSNTSIKDNVWHHLIATYKTGEIKIYIDSILKNTISTSNAPAWNIVTNFFIGGNANGEKASGAYMNDVRIYNHCLSPKEVKEISQGLVLHYKLDGWSGGSGKNLAYGTNTADVSTNIWRLSNQTGGTTNSIEYDGNTPVAVITRDNVAQSGWTYLHYDNIHPADIKPSTTYTISFDVMTSVDGTIGISALMQGNATNSKSKSVTNIQNTCTANTWSHIILQTVTKDDFTGINNSQVIYLNTSTSLRAVNTTIKMKNMKMEIGSKDTPWSPALTEIGVDDTKVIDSSGYGNDGTVTGTLSTESDSDRYEISTKSLNGTDCIKSPLSLVDVQSFTCSFWVKPSSSNGGYSIVASNYNNPSSGFWISTNCESHALWFYNSAYADTTAKSISNDYWYHCVIVCNNKTFSMYINGAQQTLNRTTSSSKTITVNNLSVFNSYTGTSWNTKRYGNISDFRFYVSALSAEDVLDLYHTSANIDDLGNLHGFEFIEDESKQSIYKNGQIATKYELQNNLWSGTQINVSNMAVTYNYQTDVFRNYGFDTCMKFTSTHIADGTSWYGYSYICDNTIVHNLAETYTFSMYAYVSTDCNANFRVHTEHANSWVSNYQGTTANINDTTKGQVIKVWGKAKTNASDGKIYLMFYFNPHLVDTFTTGYILVAGLNVVIGDTIYPPGIIPMNGFNQDKDVSSIKNNLIIMNDFIEK